MAMASSPVVALFLVVGTVVLFCGGPCGAKVIRTDTKSAMEALLRPFNFDGDLSQVIYFSSDPEWADLQAVASEHGQEVEVICIHGAWILYRNTHYVTRTSWDYAILSGSQSCIKWSNTKSMQPLGLLDDAFTPSVTFFTELHMGSIGYTVNSRRGRKYFEYLGGPVKSLIVFGMSQWTITDVKGDEFCLATNSEAEEAFPICKINDVSLSPVGTPWDIDSIIKGCPAGIKKEKLVHLRDCEYFGRGSNRGPGAKDYKISDGPVGPGGIGGGKPGGPGTEGDNGLWHWREFNAGGHDGWELAHGKESDIVEPGFGITGLTSTTSTTTQKPGPETTTTNPMEGRQCPDKKLDEFALLVAVRLNHDYEDREQILWPGRKEDVWKAELLDAAYGIALTLFPEMIVPRQYLLLIREFMMYHLTLLWKKAAKPSPAEPDQQIRSVMDDLARCAILLDTTTPFVNKLNEDMWLDRSPKEVFTQLQRHPSMDVVIDTTYLLINLVMGTCHHVFDYSTNFWVNFIHVFMKLYLTPLVKDWAKFRREDSFLLGGYDYDSQHLRIGMITTGMLRMTPSLEPFERPKALLELLGETEWDNEI